jgi:hypothetical protein
MAVFNVISGPQDALLKASRTMCERCNQYADVVASVPRFQELYVGMGSIIVKIDAAILSKQTSRHTTNVTSEKNNRITTFISSLDALAVVLVDMGVEEKNSDWQNVAARAIKTKTKSLSEEGLMATSMEFVAFLKTIDAKRLLHYGIDAAEISDMEAQIAEIKALRLKKEVTIDQKTLDNTTLATLFVELKDEKAKMERLSNRFAQKAPEFYTAFQKATVVTVKLGIKSALTRKEKTPEQLATIAAQKEAITAKKDASAAKKAETKRIRAEAKIKKTVDVINKQAISLGSSSLANGRNQASAANGSILGAEKG